ncbi:nickel-dependent hydrogenase large subunit [Arcobacter nitrofigilis DSM 7299]|uniref:Nickel-dependent hydrogenase large subunit n=1 Tax=Arcobacter nitrofigilis (strain ATCC 33309 / DSM 7299 / CCUG 15893 / LMG 7604 / NCTC 12251 / CI) TaxID=572480 RepID=D5V589_ARCNC|nr:nickel-dependent hydrogenase large subunit [Arcobacter nitrofigilis]ADG93024.1 nickel-dependent hydrogenase large subunit [Arcobacter nitrofigilis DSM 7299]
MANKRIIVDPITRIEGHLRIEVEIDENNVIKNAFASSTLWRGLETIVKNRDPRDAGFLMQRICGVCTFSHYRAGIEAVEDALKITPPLNAKLTRSLMNQALFMHDHLVHFYHLHGLDWVDITSALKADVAKASKEAFKYTKYPIATGENDLLKVKDRVKEFADRGELGPFANAYWGHETFRLTPEQNLIALSHYLKALEVQRTAAQLMAMFGGKQPHPQSLTVGGVTCVMDLLDPSRMSEYLTKYKEVANFIEHAYYADILMAGKAYASEPSVTAKAGTMNFMSHKEMQLNRSEFLFDTGIILNGDLSKVHPINEDLITEEATHSWYKDDEPLHPYDGKTNPNYTGMSEAMTIGAEGKEVHSKVIDEKGKYSWIKSPRYDGKAMEVGPLASVLVSYASGNKRIVKIVDGFLEETGLPTQALFTTLGRTAARALQVKAIIENGLETFDALIENLKVDQETYTTYKIDKEKEYKGRFIGDVPRGMLSHWIRIKNGVVENYQAVVPSTWNAGPEDSTGLKGPYESNLIGLKVKDITQPLEIIRVIHSFDPCIACAVHVMDTKGNELGSYKVDPTYGTSC